MTSIPWIGFCSWPTKWTKYYTAWVTNKTSELSFIWIRVCASHQTVSFLKRKIFLISSIQYMAWCTQTVFNKWWLDFQWAPLLVQGAMLGAREPTKVHLCWCQTFQTQGQSWLRSHSRRCTCSQPRLNPNSKATLFYMPPQANQGFLSSDGEPFPMQLWCGGLSAQQRRQLPESLVIKMWWLARAGAE